MARQSAGLLIYRRRPGGPEVFLVHPGGPFWRNKDEAAWSIPKGEFAPGEDALLAARRELREETGLDIAGTFEPLGAQRQPGGKTVHVWAIEGDCDPAAVRSNLFSMEWPPRSGRLQEFPEVDCAGWFDLATARQKLHKGQVAFLDAVAARLAG